jgi:hypothetical protein
MPVRDEIPFCSIEAIKGVGEVVNVISQSSARVAEAVQQQLLKRLSNSKVQPTKSPRVFRKRLLVRSRFLPTSCTWLMLRTKLGQLQLRYWVRLENFQSNRLSSRIRLIHSSSVSGLHSSPKKFGDYVSSLPSTIETNDRAPGPVVLYSPPLSCVALRILWRHESQL